MRYSLVSAGLCLVLLLPLAAQAEMYAYIDAKGVYHYTNAPGDGRYRLTAKPVSQRRSARTATGRGSLFGQQTQPLAPSRLESTSFTRVSNEERLLQTIASRSSSAPSASAPATTRPRTKLARQMYDLFFFDGGQSAASPMYNYGFSYRYSYPATPRDINEHIQHAARVHRLDPMLIKAVIKAESNFNPYALSPKGAQGLMQLMPDTARDLNVRNPFDARQNIFGGARYLRQMLNQFGGNLELCLAAYNAGPNRVAPIWAVPNIPETRGYVAKVLRHYRAYRSGAEGTAADARPPAAAAVMAQNAQKSATPDKTSSIKVKQLVTVQ